LYNITIGIVECENLILHVLAVRPLSHKVVGRIGSRRGGGGGGGGRGS